MCCHLIVKKGKPTTFVLKNIAESNVLLPIYDYEIWLSSYQPYHKIKNLLMTKGTASLYQYEL